MSAQDQITLVVDDEPGNVMVLDELLHEDFTVIFATDGNMALKLAAEQTPDLILLDIMMPEMDGYETCRRLKSHSKTSSIPVIFITAMQEDEDEMQGFAVGAVDYVVKPVNPQLVKSRIKTHMALRSATKRAEQAMRKLTELSGRLIAERNIIEDIVMKTRASPLLDSTDLRILDQPLERTTGDIICAAFGRDGSQRLLLGDFTGHGLTAAVGGPLVAEIFYSAIDREMATHKMFATLNHRLLHALNVEMFMACSCVEVNSKRDRATLYNAGMTDIMIFRDGSLIHNEVSEFLPRGLIDGDDRQAGSFPVQKGDRIILATDGFVESRDANGEMLGQEQFAAILERNITSGAPLEEILEALKKYRQGGPAQDDMTLVELTV